MFHRTSNLVLALISLMLPADMIGQANTFTILTDMGTPYDYANSVAVQEDGKVIVAGDAYGVPCLIRFDTSGVLDHSFGSGGKVFASWDCGMNPCDNDIKIQPDGKIVLGTSYYNGTSDDFILARYLSDGSPDSTFGDNGQVISQVGDFSDLCKCIVIQPDGKIVAGGSSNNGLDGNWNYDFALQRFHPDGTIDQDFGNNGTMTTRIGLEYNMAYAMDILEDGKIVLAGIAQDSVESYSDFAVVRYTDEGFPDSTFGNAGIVRTSVSEHYDFASSVVIQPDQKILVGGSSQNISSSDYDFVLARYNTDGTLDENFGSGGISMTDFGWDIGRAVTLQPDNKIIFAGSLMTGMYYDFATLRFDTNGALDQSFGENGLITTDFGFRDGGGESVAVRDNGEILIAGYQNTDDPDFDFALARLFSDLTLGMADQDETALDASLHPNPAHNYTFISIPHESGTVLISLVDASGRLIFYKQAGAIPLIRIPLYACQPGLYLVILENGKKIKSIKLVVE